jgi:Fic family protein
LHSLAEEKVIYISGRGKGTKYHLDKDFKLVSPVDMGLYFLKEADEREIIPTFHFALLDKIKACSSIFSDAEIIKLENLQNEHRQRVEKLSDWDYRNEMERLAIDLSWKSSQIEGNTYSLLETERLLKEKTTAEGKTKDEAVMLLNHKEAIDFIFNFPDYMNPLTVKAIEDIHALLIKELGVPKNIRNHRIGITGTNYYPLDNDFQIREALLKMCDVIEGRKNVWEKAMLLLLILSYIQPFSDGNKRTSRILSNAILMRERVCPLSFRTVDSIEYKKAMLVFYEQNNLWAFKQIFIDQFEFAVKRYF